MSNTFTSLVRLGSDPEVRFLPSGQSVLNFNAASSVGFGDNKKTIWIRVAYWRNAEKLQPFLHKGDQCLVSGELTQSEYRANDGTTKTSLELNANIIDLIGSKKDSDQLGAQAKPSQLKQSQHHEQKSNGYAPRSGDNFEDFDDSIPF